MNPRAAFLKFATALSLVTSVLTAHAQENDPWLKANEEFAAGHFREAADLYDGLVKGGQPSAPVFYNLGNAHFRAGEFGQAILNYERALALEPRHPEAMANLRLARDKARALELKRTTPEIWAGRITSAQYSVAAAIAFWIALFAIVALFLSRHRSPALVGLAILSLIVLGVSAYGLSVLEYGPRGRTLAIVTAKGTDARLAAADNAGVVLTLPVGSEIKILSTRGDWLYAALPNDLRGWIPAKNAEPVRQL